MLIKDYVQGAYAVLAQKNDVDALLVSLKEYLRTRGLSSLYPKILRGLQEKIRRSQKTHTPKLRIARASDQKNFEKEIEAEIAHLKIHEAPQVEIDPTLIGGFVIKSAHLQTDKSYKATLLQAYRSLTD